MPLRSRRVAYISAAVLAAIAAAPAFGHDDDKEGAGNGGPTPGGLPFITFTSHNMVLRSRLDLTELDAPGADADTMLASAWGWTDPLNDKEYALVCRRSDLAIVDITDPDVPVLVGNVLRNGAATTWRDVRVVGNHAFIGADSTNAGIQTFDLTRVRGVTTPTLFTADALFTGVSNSHSLGVNLNTSTPYVYAAGANTLGGSPPPVPQTAGGLQILDVSNPLALSTAASWQTDAYIHETVVFTYNGPDTAHVGKEIAINNNGGPSTNSMSILDASNKSSLVRLSESVYPNTGYTHQGYLTDDHRFYLINDELDETGNLTGDRTRTHLYDVTDLDNPVYKGFFEWGTGNIDHNLYIVGDYLYEANYTRGVRVFRIWDLDSSDPADWLQEVAWLDTYPADDSKTFNGVWQVYPFFESGSIIASDINGGLFVMNFVPEPTGLAALGLCGAFLLRRRRVA